jgi:hypothetical protein
MTKTYLALAFLITSLLAGDAYGEASAEKYLDTYKKSTGKERFVSLMYIAGMGIGITWMESEVASLPQKKYSAYQRNYQ